jgi:SAM-dependent methyltransferase
MPEASDMAAPYAASATEILASPTRRLSAIDVNRELDPVLSWLKSVKPRLGVTDGELLELFWEAHPRFQFFASLNWGTNLLDLGAGSGGLAHWKHWAKPARPDLNLYGVDRTVGEHRALYAGWEAIDLDRQIPEFSGIKLTGFFASHLIEQLAAPERVVEWIGRRAEPGARVYLEWPSPTTIVLPGRDDLRRNGFEVLISNFRDDPENRNCPDLAAMCGWLRDAGLTIVGSGAVDLGILGEELFARAPDRDARSMGYWSMMQFSLYAVAVKPGIPADADAQAVTMPRVTRDAAEVAPTATIPQAISEADEITASFTDISEWHRFSEARPHLSDPGYISSIVEGARTNGLSSAFLGAISAEDVKVTGDDYREHLQARGLNSRCRAVLELIAAEPWYRRPTATIYTAEAVTPFALALRGRFPRFIGSEYASNEAAREALFPIPFQDLGKLTFPPDRFDCVVTNDCLEHVPDIGQCLGEICRVLRRGGVMLSTFPFTFVYDSAVKARLVDGEIEHLDEPEYHGNPAEPEARSLVFEIPGWNILDRARQAGFSRAEMVFVSGRKRAITASEVAGVFVLRCYK